MTYDASKVKILEPVEAIRERPTMYIGHTTSEGIFHLFKEVADNSIDEMINLAGEAGEYGRMTVLIDARRPKEGCHVWVHDTGRGIPVEEHADTGNSTLTDILTRTHAGAKFGSDAYGKGSIGTHGVGLTAVNALSAEMEVWTYRDEDFWNTAFQQGAEVSPVQAVNLDDCPIPDEIMQLFGEYGGTVTYFCPDMAIMSGALDLERVQEWCYMSSILNPGLTVSLKTMDNPRKEAWTFEEDYYSENGMGDFMDAQNAAAGLDEFGRFDCVEDIFDESGERVGSIAACVSFIEQEEYEVRGFTNTSYNEEGGTHTVEFTAALFRSLERFGKRQHKFALADVKSNTVCMLNIAMQEPQFRGQTKEKLTDPRGKEFMVILEEALDAYFAKHKAVAQRLCELATARYKDRSDNSLNREVGKLFRETGRRALLPADLSSVDCKPEEREIFIVEGKSAGGQAKKARGLHWQQEVMGVRGKMMNVSRQTRNKIAQSQEVLKIFLALGYDISAADVSKKLRIRGDGKLIFLADPDPDGLHIVLLLMTIVGKLMPDLLYNGNVYIARIPEFMAVYKGTNYYGLDKADLMEQVNADHPAVAITSLDVSHFKGLAEMPVAVLREVAFNPASRTLLRVVPEDGDEIENFLGMMSYDIDQRKSIVNV